MKINKEKLENKIKDTLTIAGILGVSFIATAINNELGMAAGTGFLILIAVMLTIVYCQSKINRVLKKIVKDIEQQRKESDEFIRRFRDGE